MQFFSDRLRRVFETVRVHQQREFFIIQKSLHGLG